MKKVILLFILLSLTLTGCNSSGEKNSTAEKDTAAGPPAITNTNTPEQPSPVSAAPEQPSPVSAAPEREYIPPEMKGEITVSVMDDSEIINTAAKVFMDKYPDVKVTVNTFRKVEPIKVGEDTLMSGTPSEEFSTENYLSLLNTKIMTGKAEDIIMTDPISLGKYTEMGAFEDLSFFLGHSPEINEESHYMQVFDFMKDANGSIYEIPLTWHLSRIIYFDKALTEDSGLYLDDSIQTMSYTEAFEHAKKLADGTSRDNTFLEIGNSAMSAATSIINDNFAEFVDTADKKADVNNERFITILREAKALEEQGYYDTNSTIDFYNMEYHFALGEDFLAYQAAYYALNDTQRYHSMPLSDAAGNVGMRAYPCFGMSGASKNKELAWEFMKFLLSEEIQTSPALYGAGVNKKGFDAFNERILKMYNDGNGADISMRDYEGVLKGWMSQINSYDRGDPVIGNEFIYPELSKFFREGQSAEETARILQAKLDKYLNE